MASAFTHLRSLNLRGNDKVTDEGLKALQWLTTLTSLDISGTSVTSKTARLITKSINLVDLSLDAVIGVSTPTLAIIVGALPELRRLSLAGCAVDDTVVTALTSGTESPCKLRVLNLNACPITDYSVQRIALFAKEISYLFLKKCSLLTLDILISIAQHCSKLKLLDVSLIPSIINDDLTPLHELFPRTLFNTSHLLMGANDD
jgi:hypothetical protein